MSIEEYAEDISKSKIEIINMCEKLNIEPEDGMLTDEDIIILDNCMDTDDKMEDLAVDIAVKEKIDLDNNVSTQKVNKNRGVVNKPKNSKKELATKKKQMYKSKEKLQAIDVTIDDDVILYSDNMTIGQLAKKLNVVPALIIKKLFSLGMMATINNGISFENAELLVDEYGKKLIREEEADVANFEAFEVTDSNESLLKRPPVVTIMGHVDHGKTTLLDTIRKSSVALNEAGGITQAISAYQITHKDEKITFIDTPGHAAFTEMRSRGASITDIIIIIVAADDGVMPQTIEVIDHAKAADVPIIVAVNKIDKQGADVERVKQQMAEHGLSPEEWGGDTMFVNISALNNVGIDDLLDNILLIAEISEYKANPARYAMGTVIEAELDKHVGARVTVLVENGTLRLGDPLVVGTAYGKVRTLKNDLGNEIMEAKPSTPVVITGIGSVPVAGDKFMAFETEKQARNIGEQRKSEKKQRDNMPAEAVTLDDLFNKIEEGLKEINVIVKSDVHGSSEAVKNSLEKIKVEDVKINVIRSTVGAITQSDIILANASDAIVIGFNVRPNNSIRDFAKENDVDIRLYNIIYKIVEDMELAMKGMLEPIFEEKITGDAEVRQLFKFSKVGIIAGSYITNGVVKSNSMARIIRDGVVIYDGNIDSIHREKDSVKEVKKGFECGITIENYSDIKEGDVIEAFEMIEIKR